MAVYVNGEEVGVIVDKSIKLEDATATENDIVAGKTAYTGEGKITGTYVDRLQWKCDNVKSLYYEFYNYGGTDLSILEGLDTSNVTNMTYMFYNCSNLTTIPQLDTSNVTDMTYMFYNCLRLETVSGLDLYSAQTLSSVFYNCKALTNLTLYNIRIALRIGSGTSYGHLLTLDSLINTVKELWDYSSGTTTYTLTMGTANLAKITDTYVKLIDITDEMREKDQYIDNKKPCEVCESADEGAMLLKDYATLKNWALA